MGYFSLPFILLEDINNMNNYKIITLRERPELVASAAEWFHSKWGVPARGIPGVYESVFIRKNRVWLVYMLI